MMPTRSNQNWLPSIFNDFFGNEWIGRSSTAPAVNVIEKKDKYLVEVAAPGLCKEDFVVRIDEDNNLSLTMEKKEEKKEENEESRYLRREFSYAKYQQTILLPDNVDKDKIAAEVDNGVLHINIPKLSEEETKKKQRVIEIK